MTKAELFALFAKYDYQHAQAVGTQDIFERAEKLDDVLTNLLAELAHAAKEN